MAIEKHDPILPSSKGVFTFVRQTSKEKGGYQAISDTALQEHPELGRVVTIKTSTTGGNTVVHHIPIQQLAIWLTQAVDAPPDIAALVDIEPDFSQIDIDALAIR